MARQAMERSAPTRGIALTATNTRGSTAVPALGLMFRISSHADRHITRPEWRMTQRMAMGHGMVIPTGAFMATTSPELQANLLPILIPRTFFRRVCLRMDALLVTA